MDSTAAGIRPNEGSSPDGLPILSRGGHVDPEQGACFMEYASLLAGGDFTDRPRCTHPLLAHTARMVNDVLDDQDRQRIAPLIPNVIQVASPAAPMTAALVSELTGMALTCNPKSRRLARLHRRARRRVQAAGFRRWAVTLSEPVYRTGAAPQAITLSLHTISEDGPSALILALEAAVAVARRVAGLPAPPSSLPATGTSESLMCNF